jgi:hypothetical protein
MPVWALIPERTVTLEEGLADGTTWVDAKAIFALEELRERKGRRIHWGWIEDPVGQSAR